MLEPRGRRRSWSAGAQGNPWALAEIVGDSEAAAPREEVAGELLFFMGETVRELGERRATGFLKKFYGWYLGDGRFPKPFKQELVQLATVAEVEQRLLAAEPRAVDVAERLREEARASTSCCCAADLGVRRRLTDQASPEGTRCEPLLVPGRPVQSVHGGGRWRAADRDRALRGHRRLDGHR